MQYCTVLEANKYHIYDWEKDPDFSLDLSWWDYIALLEEYQFKIDIGRYLDFRLSVTPEKLKEIISFVLNHTPKANIPRNGINELLDFINDIKQYNDINLVIYQYEVDSEL